MPLDRRVREVELVLDLAHDLLEDVLERDDPVHRAVLVDDDGHVLLLPPEIGEQRGEVLRLRDDVRGPNDRLEPHGRDTEIVHRGEEVADVEHADDLVERVAVDRVARERRVDHGRERILGRHVDGDRDHLRPRHHHRRDLLRGEVEDLVEHLLLGLLELSDVLRCAHAVTDVLARVGDHPGRRGGHPKEPEHRIRGHLQDPDERVRDAGEEVDGDGEGHGKPLRALERDGFRYELTEDDGEVREDDEGHGEGDPGRERRLEEVGEEWLADGADQDGEHGDPELDEPDEAHRLVHQPERGSRTSAALLGSLVEARATPGDERVLGGDEDRAPHDQEEHDDDPQEDAHEHTSPAFVTAGQSPRNAHAPRGAPVLGGISSPINQAAV